jgi:hypothetical protein
VPRALNTVGHDVDVGLDVLEYAAADVAFARAAFAAFAADDRARGR